ncbi:T9SS type A sorting domain-containing protein [Empedobacter stercoris]|uniref:T9SS type A sorting domain-containing protein n=1 Tax=Empedobacter stercoris TaxID=1628248 RepID=A0ABX1WJU3_9FLAO|nr:T9SS type A sorting domain-containing protein [Empedobacter stercoris]NOJ74880.1 T9SS type A sorting domain-containing protein [Empedobacter stercoris]QNT13895.1 T9SS type A sorting domain-containing protein [Empedobacter stercoris]
MLFPAVKSIPIWYLCSWSSCLYIFFTNPTTDIIQIKTKGNLTSSVVYNLQGQIVLKSTKNEIDVSHLPNGIYILKTLIDGKEATKKIIKK